MTNIQDIYESKKKKTQDFQPNEDTANRLFFAARNGIIASVLRNIEHYCFDRGFPTYANWKESSIGNPRIELIFKGKKEYIRSISIQRDSIWPEPKSISPCTYRLIEINLLGSEGRKPPKKIEDWETHLNSQDFFTFLEKEINRINYPFDKDSFSIF